MSSKVNKSDRIRQALKKGVARAEIVKTLKVSPQLVYAVARKGGYLKKKKPSRLLTSVLQAKEMLDLIENKPTKLIVQPQYKEAALKLLGAKEADIVNHPPHYKAGGIETLDFIEAKDLNFRLGNVVKYVSRAGKKPDSDPVKDLEKAAFYLNREIETRKRA